MQLHSTKTNDVYLNIPAHFETLAATQPTKSVTLLFFITGNPGLLSYYHEFFTDLSKAPTTKAGPGTSKAATSAQDCITAGFSLGGFEENTGTSDSDLADALLFPVSYPRHPPGQTYTLQDQIKLTHARLQHLTALILKHISVSTPSPSLQVILQGHSVGAYIALSLLPLIHGTQAPFTVAATHLLTPTITHLAASSSGRIAGPMLTFLPFVPWLAQAGAGMLGACLPENWLRGLVQRVSGMREGAGLETTVRFLRARGMVRQALDLAGWELREIRGEEWGEDIVWGLKKCCDEESVESGVVGAWRAPKHYFLFARKDHWVADETRDEILQARQGRARIVVDEGGRLVHAWCLGQSDLVAEIIREWIEDVVGTERVWGRLRQGKHRGRLLRWHFDR